MIDCEAIIAQFYERDTRLWDVLLTHSRCVADLAMQIVDRHPELGADRAFVYEASMLHDIGIITTDAPSIHCHGTDPYICHGINGRAMLDGLGLPSHALVCERHTGSGLSADYIRSLRATDGALPLPVRDMLPVTIEEKIVCYADKFFSKSKSLTTQKSFERALHSVAKFGDESRQRFMAMDALLHIDTLI